LDAESRFDLLLYHSLRTAGDLEMVSLTRPTLPETRVSLGAVWVALLTLGTGLAQTPAQPQYTIRARIPLTIVDVIVTDSKGRPVHGLQQSDFTILEDNQPMTPNSFEGHLSGRASSVAAPMLVKQPLPPNIDHFRHIKVKHPVF
jgi:hypothetical protein